MRVVIDTNVLVSGLLTPYGSPAEIVRMIVLGILEPCYDGRILSEYEEVLKRPKFGFYDEEINALMEYIIHAGFSAASQPVPSVLTDPDDEPFLEVAIASGARYLITGDTKHFHMRTYKGIKIVPPLQFLKEYRK